MKVKTAILFSLIASPAWAYDPCQPNSTITLSDDEGPIAKAGRQMRERECYERRKSELSDLRHEVEMLKLQRGGSSPAAGYAPPPRETVRPSPKPRKPNPKCLPTRSEVKALGKLYEYELHTDAARKRAEAAGGTYYSSNYWEEWHAGTDPSRKAVDRLQACGYQFPYAYGTEQSD